MQRKGLAELNLSMLSQTRERKNNFKKNQQNKGASEMTLSQNPLKHITYFYMTHGTYYTAVL